MIKKFIVSIYFIIRNFRSKRINKKWDNIILKSLPLRNLLISIYKKFEGLNSGEKCIKLYNELYKAYKSDGLKGIYDWSPSLSTIVCKGSDDCDSSSALWEELGKFYLKSEGIFYKEIYSCAFVCSEIRNLVNSHVICIAELDKGFYIFDYNYIMYYETLEDIKKYYVENYIKDEKTNIKKLILKRIPNYSCLYLKY
jgi:hypothetical protein